MKNYYYMLVGISEAIRVLFSKFFKNLSYLFDLSLMGLHKQCLHNSSMVAFASRLRLMRSGKGLLSRTRIKVALRRNSLAGVITPNCTLKQGKKKNTLAKSLRKAELEKNKFNQWLAGLIDGDGCFLLSKKGYASLEITIQTRDKKCLYAIKQKFGGSIKIRSGIDCLRYRMHHKKGLLDLINAVNGEIRNPTRLLQLKQICNKYEIQLIEPELLTYNNGWLSGFMDSDGSVYLNLQSAQMFITASQKDRYLLDIICDLYGGTVYTQKTNFKWSVYKKIEIIKLLEYFKLYPSRSAKHNRFKAIPRYFELRKLKAHLATKNSLLGKEWIKFISKWEHFG